MPSLSDTVGRLAAMRAKFATKPDAAAAGRLSDFAWRGANPGALNARSFKPARLADGAPLVVVLHGCTQTADSYDFGSGWSTLADHAGFSLLFPEQSRANNPNLCFNWFQPEDIRRGAGEALSIRQMIEAFAAEHGIDRRRIFITGLSAGGAMTSVMLATYPEVFAGGAIIAGLPYGSANTVPEAFDRMRGHGAPSTRDLQALLRRASSHAGPWPTLSVWHGDADRTVAAGNMEQIIAQWQALHGVAEAPTRRETVDGQARRVWCDGQEREVIESYTVAGMGHGTPLGATGEGGYGRSGPFMLDAGISSTLRIAQFWGIAGERATARDRRAASSAPSRSQDITRVDASSGRSDRPRRLQDVKAEPPSPSPASGVHGVIEGALRAAGLMK